MSRSSRRLSLIAVVAACAALAGCGSDSSSDDGTSTGAAATQPTMTSAAPAPAETTTAPTETQGSAKDAKPTTPDPSGAIASAAQQNGALLDGDYKKARSLYSAKCAAGLTRTIFDTVRGAYRKITEGGASETKQAIQSIAKPESWEVRQTGAREAVVTFPKLKGVQAQMVYENGTWKDDSCSHQATQAG